MVLSIHESPISSSSTYRIVRFSSSEPWSIKVALTSPTTGSTHSAIVLFIKHLLRFPLDRSNHSFIMKMNFNFNKFLGKVMRKFIPSFICLLALISALAACGKVQSPSSSQPGKLNVVATTTIVGDVVRNIGGDAIQLSVLLPAGVDVHSFQPTPQDVPKLPTPMSSLPMAPGWKRSCNPCYKTQAAKPKLSPFQTA